MIALDRGSVTISVRNGKCEACHVDRLGVMFSGAADCPLLICALCLGDAFVQALPTLSREFVKRPKELAPCVDPERER